VAALDPGPDALASLAIPGLLSVAELEVETIEDEALQSQHAIFLYVTSGELRFHRPQGRRQRSKRRDPGALLALMTQLQNLQAGTAQREDVVAALREYGPQPIARRPVALTEIPEITLSEVLRDIDLFVTVAGIAADPQWPLTAPEEWQGAWREHAYGELTPLGESRRSVLARVLPALAIADRLELEERFLRVRGNVHSYRIHLGTGNVQMVDSGRHLCIVPSGGGRLPGEPRHYWLPFEGDDTLTQILSKALLLSADDAIDDLSIRAQIEAE
jgi:hypothetical protein